MMDRGEFLTTTAALGAVAIAASPATAASTDAQPDIPAFEARLAKPAKHRQVVAAVPLRNGSFLHYMKNTLNAYEFAYREGPGTTHVAAVLYGDALIAILDDAIWNEHRLGDFLAEQSDVPAPAGDLRRNPFTHRGAAFTASGNPNDALYMSESVTALVQRGSSFFVCNNALTGLCQKLLRSNDAPTIEALRRRMVAHFVDGALLVPAGTAAINAAQEAHFTYLLGSGV